MLAVRLANNAGWLGSVDDMLDLFTPAEFDERIAAQRLDGSPADWIERIAAILKLGFAGMAMSRCDPETFDPLNPKRLKNHQNTITSPYDSGEDAYNDSYSQPVASPRQAAAMFAGAFGPPKRKSHGVSNRQSSR